MSRARAERGPSPAGRHISVNSRSKFMFTKKVLVSALIAAGTMFTAAASLPAVAASSSVEIYVNTPPPPPRHEVVPPPRHGYVWAPGHWEWREGRHRHAWID